MRAFNKIFAAVIGIILLIFAGTNLLLTSLNDTDSGRLYRVEINRLALEIEKNGLESVNLSDCQYVTQIEKYGDDFYEADSDSAIREINGELYRFDYNTNGSSSQSHLLRMVNIILGVMTLLIITVMLYIKRKILLPFEKLSDVPYELAKGNLTSPIKENKSRFFGRFIWGVDLLRENMEQQKQHELDLQRDKKMLLLSLSHDIKTPLSAIKLYAKALSKELYKSKEKQIAIAESIHAKADEIESYVSQIITASREDFLSLDVHNDEFYLSELVDKISTYYCEKLSLIKTDFNIGNYTNCILYGDLDRSVEVLQNVMENAIKYGDEKNIDIQFSEEDGCLLMTVRNSGCTLSENELPHIFESFWRGANAGNQKGSGLGLYICRQLMHKMNGEIFAERKDDLISVSVVFSKV